MKKLLFTIFGIALLSVGLMAQTITPIPAGGSWTTARTTINANDEIASDSMAILQAAKAPLASPTFTGTVSLPTTWRINGTTVTSMAAELNILDGALVTYAELNKLVGIGTDTIATRAYARLVGAVGSTDTTSLSARIDLKAPIDDPNFTGVPLLATNDTLATRSYARTYGGTGTVTVGDVRDEIADSLNVLRPKTLVGNGTVGPFFDGTQDGGSLLYFYGSNGFWTALQGGAPTANRSYRLPIAALPSAGTTSLMNIDENGNMGFVASTTYATASHNQAQSTITALSDSLLARYTKTQMDLIISGLETGSFDTTRIYQILDSLTTVLGDSVNIEALLQVDFDTDTVATKAYARSVGGGIASIDSLILNGGSLRLTGDDRLTFETNGNASYSLPAGGGNLMLQSAIQDMVSDSLDAVRTDVRLLVDTIPIFVFGLGSGVAADTAVFNDNAIVGAFYNAGSDTLKITSLIGVLAEGSGTETIAVQVSWHATFKSGSATTLNSSALTVNSITTGTSDTSFAADEIPPGVFVWCTISGTSAGNRPSLLILTMSGYRIPKY